MTWFIFSKTCRVSSYGCRCGSHHESKHLFDMLTTMPGASDSGISNSTYIHTPVACREGKKSANAFTKHSLLLGAQVSHTLLRNIKMAHTKLSFTSWLIFLQNLLLGPWELSKLSLSEDKGAEMWDAGYVFLQWLGSMLIHDISFYLHTKPALASRLSCDEIALMRNCVMTLKELTDLHLLSMVFFSIFLPCAQTDE